MSFEPESRAHGSHALEVLAPTGLEYWAVRCMLLDTRGWGRPPRGLTGAGRRLYQAAYGGQPGGHHTRAFGGVTGAAPTDCGRKSTYGGMSLRVTCAGMGLARWEENDEPSMAIVCGLAGALVPGLRPGTVVVPELVSCTDGTELRCDPVLRDALAEGARALSFDLESGPLLTAPSLVTGDARHEWAQRGFIAADMETGLLAGRNIRVATVRVILDSPERSISEQWGSPARALVQPALWGELLWLCRSAPLYALRAARVLKAGLDRLPTTERW